MKKIIRITELDLARIVKRVIKENEGREVNFIFEDTELHDPRGGEVKVGRFLIHKSMPENREEILKNGLLPKIGERYQMDNNRYTTDRIPAIFATNSEDEKHWFGEDLDEDVWKIDTSLIPNVKWYKDKMFSFSRSGFPFPFLYKHVVTIDSIPTNALELIYKGSGKLKISESYLARIVKRVIREN